MVLIYNDIDERQLHTVFRSGIESTTASCPSNSWTVFIKATAPLVKIDTYLV